MLVVELQRIDTRPRGGGQVAQLHERRPLVAQHEPFGHQHHGLRYVDRLQAEQQGAERVDRLLTISDAVGRYPFGLHLQGNGTELQRRTERFVGALAADQVIELKGVATLHRDRLGQRDLIQAEAPRRALADHPRDDLLHPLAVGGEWRRRRAGTDADGRHSIRRLETIQEAVEGGTDADGAPESDVRLIDKEDDEASAGGVLVGAIPGGRRGRARTFGRRKRHPLGTDDAPRDTLDANA